MTNPTPHSDDAKLPEPPPAPPASESPQVSPGNESGGGFVLKALGGFLGAPLLLACCIPANSPAPFWLLVIGTLAMLFFRGTRAVALGSVLFVLLALLVLAAICGNGLRNI